MTDEEMAKEYSKSVCAWIEDREPLDEIDIQEAYLAGLKAGRPKWHKVADGDLPKKDERFLSKISIPVMTQSNGFAFYSFEYKKWCFQGKVVDVIAWCELPQFTDKELKND